MELLANSNGSGVKAVLGPAVTGSVAAAASKMQLCQEEELVWHHAIRMGDGNGLGTPVYCQTSFFIMRIGTVATGGLQIVVWHKRKQAVGIFVTVFKLDPVPIGFEALVTVSSRR